MFSGGGHTFLVMCPALEKCVHNFIETFRALYYSHRFACLHLTRHRWVCTHMRHPAGTVLSARPGQDGCTGRDRVKTNDFRSSAALNPTQYQSFHKGRKTSPSFWPLAETTALTKDESNRGGKQKNYKKLRIIVIVIVTLAITENYLPSKTCRALWCRENSCTSIVLGVKLSRLSSFSDTDRISHTYIKIIIIIFVFFTFPNNAHSTRATRSNRFTTSFFVYGSTCKCWWTNSIIRSSVLPVHFWSATSAVVCCHSRPNRLAMI